MKLKPSDKEWDYAWNELALAHKEGLTSPDEKGFLWQYIDTHIQLGMKWVNRHNQQPTLSHSHIFLCGEKVEFVRASAQYERKRLYEMQEGRM